MLHFILAHAPVFILVFLSSAVVCAVLVQRCRQTPIRWRRTGDERAVQCAHATPASRFGGLGLMAGVVVTALLVPIEASDRYLVFVLSLIPVFAAGLAEDLGFRVAPRWRLAAAALSSVIVVATLGVWLSEVGIPGLDPLLHITPVAIFATVFFVTGMCHAFNLIDGLNGLASGGGIIVGLGLAMIAYQAGDSALVWLNLLVVAAIAGFFVYNFPGGKVFLGDAGAYLIGHVLAWHAIVLTVRVDAFTPIAFLLIFFWPIADTLLAIYRRYHKKCPVGQPDRLHFHQLVMRALEIVHIGRGRRDVSNPLTTAILLPVISLPVIAGVLLWDKPVGAAIAICVFGFLFVASYRIGLAWAARRGRLRAEQDQPSAA
jgi:UDP-GlcNAc:undecaprenyl-phosphate/decaprenyl-phosphate GlcNAc-1-phosphate transferase